VEYHLILCKDLELLSIDEFGDLETKVLEVQRMLAAFVQRLLSDSVVKLAASS
jgi:hypothetical protein